MLFGKTGEGEGFDAAAWGVGAAPGRGVSFARRAENNFFFVYISLAFVNKVV